MFIDPVRRFAAAALTAEPVEVHERGDASLFVVEVSDLTPEAVAMDRQTDGVHLARGGGDDLIVGNHPGDSSGDRGL